MAASKKTSPSHRDQVAARQLIDNFVSWASSAPGDMEVFTLRVPDPEPGVVEALQNTAMLLEREGEYEGATVGEDSYVGRMRHIIIASGLNPTELAEELDIPRSTVYRWTKTRESGGVPPSYTTLEKFAALAKRHGIPGNLLDDSSCLPMTVEPVPDPPTRRPKWPKSAAKQSRKGILVTLSSAGLQLLKERSRNIGQKVVAPLLALSDSLIVIV